MRGRWVKAAAARGKHFAHHAYVAATLALVILVLEHHGWLNWLDSISLRAALAVKDAHTAALEVGRATSARELPQVVTIDEATFEITFAQESPLHRRRLGAEIARLSALKPSTIVIDLDLSPGPADSVSLDGQAELDALLIELAATKETRVVLSTPFAVASDALFTTKFEWMQRLCRGGVRFGYPDIQLSQGLALRFSPAFANLAVVALGRHETADGSRHGPGDLTDEPCTLIRQGPNKAVFLSTAFAPELQFDADRFREQLPLDSNDLRAIALDRRSLEGGTKESRSATTSSVVFLGSSFDPRDSFLTIYGTQPGVVLHAAAYSSLQYPPSPITHRLAFVFDVILGVAAGVLFGWSWRRYNAATAALHSRARPPFRTYLAARVWLFLNLAILVGWLFILFSWSAVLLRLHLWSNPGAMVIGVFVKNQLASRSSIGQPERSSPVLGTERGTKHVDQAKVMLWDMLLISPAIVYGAWLLAFSH